MSGVHTRNTPGGVQEGSLTVLLPARSLILIITLRLPLHIYQRRYETLAYKPTHFSSICKNNLPGNK